jgi:hypothetical protein
MVEDTLTFGKLDVGLCGSDLRKYRDADMQT